MAEVTEMVRKVGARLTIGLSVENEKEVRVLFRKRKACGRSLLDCVSPVITVNDLYFAPKAG